MIEDGVFVGPGLASALKHKGSRIRVQRVVPNWVAYTEAFDEASGVVVLQADLSDHVPVVLKVRALTAIGAASVVIADEPTTQHVRRLREAGALAVFTRRNSFDELLEQLMNLIGAIENDRQLNPEMQLDEVKLSDRELQVVCLYAGHAAPSASVIAQRLGVPIASVRTHLQRARLALREHGAVSTRRQLRELLAHQGWMDGSN